MNIHENRYRELEGFVRDKRWDCMGVSDWRVLVEALQERLAAVSKTADGVPIKDGMVVWESPRHRGLATKTVASITVEIRPCDYARLYSTREAAEAAKEQNDERIQGQ